MTNVHPYDPALRQLGLSERPGQARSSMSGSIPRCPSCGDDLVLELDPDRLPDTQAKVVLADPPFRFVCRSPGCAHPERRIDH